MSWKIQVHEDRVVIGERFSISFQRTLRVPEDGQAYPLPPSLGAFPVLSVKDFAAGVPSEWLEGNAPGAFIPMYQREAMWLAFEGASWKPCAVKVGVGQVNALSGADWDAALHAAPQDYLVCPLQPWLDGIIAGEGLVRQFVAMPLGAGYTVEAQLTGRETSDGLQVLVYDPLPGIFPDQPPPTTFAAWGGPMGIVASGLAAPEGMGIGAGGQITQKVYPDPHGLETWDQSSAGRLVVHILNSEQYRQITGQIPPPTPVDARTYTEHGFPWFKLYDEELGALPAAPALSGAKSIGEIDAERGLPPGSASGSIEIDPSQVQPVDRQRRNL